MIESETVWFLRLNDMRSAHVEDLELVAFGPTSESLEQLIQRESVERYVTDGKWHKTFRAGGPLEWYNDPAPGFEADHFVCAPRYVDRAAGLLSAV